MMHGNGSGGTVVSVCVPRGAAHGEPTVEAVRLWSQLPCLGFEGEGLAIAEALEWAEGEWMQGEGDFDMAAAFLEALLGRQMGFALIPLGKEVPSADAYYAVSIPCPSCPEGAVIGGALKAKGSKPFSGGWREWEAAFGKATTTQEPLPGF